MILTRSRKKWIGAKLIPLQRRWRVKDPITLSRIRRAFVYVDKNGTEMYFDASVLADYIQSTGDYANPLTRVEFNIVEIRRLSKRAGRPEIMDVSARKHERALAAERDSLRSFFLSEIDSDLLSIIEDISEAPPMIQIHRMVTGAFPNLIVSTVRILRTDRSFLPDFFEHLFRSLETMRNNASLGLQTTIYIYEQFCRDLRLKAEDRRFALESSVNINVGGMNIIVDTSG